MKVYNPTSIARILNSREHGSYQIQPHSVENVPDDVILADSSIQVIDGPKASKKN